MVEGFSRRVEIRLNPFPMTVGVSRLIFFPKISNFEEPHRRHSFNMAI
jgi:hypothetical protein